MVRWEDSLREHPFFSRAAISAAAVYVKLYDQPNLAHGSLSNGVNGDKMDSAERKKAEKKARKEREKQEKAEAEKKDGKKAAVDQNGDPKKEDKDPKGDLRLQSSEPLVEAMKFINPLLEFSPRNIQAQQAGFEVFIRRSKHPSTFQPFYKRNDLQISRKIPACSTHSRSLPRSLTIKSYHPRTDFPLPANPLQTL